jgi:hypothetical protein
VAARKEFCLVCLSQDSREAFSHTFVKDYIRWSRYLVGTNWHADTPFSRLKAIPNEEYQNQDRREFLIPSDSIVWVLVHQDERVLGFGERSRP